MNWLLMGFVVFPAVVSALGLIFCVVFATDIIQWFTNIRSAETVARVSAPTNEDIIRTDADELERARANQGREVAA